MQKYVAFLRGINLGRRRPPMSRLRELFAELGFTEVATFIASGNVLFASKATETGQLETKIARHLEESLGYKVDTFVRTADEVVAIDRFAAFPTKAGDTVHVGFLHEKLPVAVARMLEAVRTAEDAFRVRGREYYWLCRVRTSESKVWTSPELKALKLPSSSMRNLTSLHKLVEKHLS
ncbi:MAG: DUF1697 domain-containing protein [Chthoniobacterales bacterium]